MNLLEIEQSKQISIKCKELLLFLTDENEISFVKSIYDNSEKNINNFNKSNITTINPTPTEIGKFNSAVKSYARSYFGITEKNIRPEYPKQCNKCLAENKLIEARERLTGVFEQSAFCDDCSEKEEDYFIEYNNLNSNYQIKLKELYAKTDCLNIDQYWRNAYILLSRKYWDISRIDELGKATKEIIKTEILKQISTIKLN